MVERRLPKPVFAGSIPVSRSIMQSVVTISYGILIYTTRRRESNREPRVKGALFLLIGNAFYAIIKIWYISEILGMRF